MAYLGLVRSTLEYAASIWDPHLSRDINTIEKVQRRAARFVKSDYRRTSSVTAMLDELGWKNLADRRRELRLALLYKVTHGLVAVPADSLNLTPPTRLTRSNHKHKYQTICTNTNEYKNSLIPRTIPEWNSLPASIAEAETIVSFKAQLAKF